VGGASGQWIHVYIEHALSLTQLASSSRTNHIVGDGRDVAQHCHVVSGTDRKECPTNRRSPDADFD